MQKLKVKPPLSFFNLADEAVEEQLKESQHNETKKQIWLKMADDLLTSNFKRENIFHIVKESIEEKWWNKVKESGVPRDEIKVGTWFYEVMNEAEFHPKISVPKDGNSSDFTPRLNHDSACREARLDDIAYFRKLKEELPEIFDMMIDLLQKDYITLEEEGKEKHIDLDWSTYYNNWESVVLMEHLKDHLTTWIPQLKRQLDTRQKLLPNMMSICVAVKESGLTIQNFCSEYYSKVKAVTEISTKAYRKYLNEVKSSTNYLDFCLDEPWKWNTMFFPCPKCHQHKLKVQPSPDGKWHFVCKNKKAHKDDADSIFPASLFTEKLTTIMNNRGGMATRIRNLVGIKVKTNDTK